MSRAEQGLQPPLAPLAVRKGTAARLLSVSDEFFAAEIGPEIPCVRRGRVTLYSTRHLAEWVDKNASLVFEDRRAA